MGLSAERAASYQSDRHLYQDPHESDPRLVCIRGPYRQHQLDPDHSACAAR